LGLFSDKFELICDAFGLCCDVSELVCNAFSWLCDASSLSSIFRRCFSNLALSWIKKKKTYWILCLKGSSIQAIQPF
jgi:hypothetical protein